MKKILLTTLLVITANVFAQTEATTKDGKKVVLNSNGTWIYADCANLLKTTTNSAGKTTVSTKENIIVSADGGKTGLSIYAFKGTESVIINFGMIEQKMFCVREKNVMKITFTDGTTTATEHMSKLNCEGNFTFFLGEVTGNNDVLQKVSTKQIQKISIEYTDTVNGKLTPVMVDTTFDKATAQKFMQTIQCLGNL